MCCVIEMEDAIAHHFGGDLVKPQQLIGQNVAGAVVFMGLLSYHSMEKHLRTLADLKQRGAIIVLYVFDAWKVRETFYSLRTKVRSRVFVHAKLSNVCDHLLVPFEFCKADFEPQEQACVTVVPMGVDSTRVNGLNPARPITLLAYGRQPETLSAYLSQRLNDPATDTVMHHTDHYSIRSIDDFYAHRRHFWKLAQSSAVALAYDPRATHPERFSHSIVGQRWFECLAAGCAVMGRRPVAPDADRLLDWQDATIELPDDPVAAEAAILELARDTNRLAEIRERNVANIKARHEWHHRLAPILAGL